jgi:hypothetical protein
MFRFAPANFRLVGKPEVTRLRKDLHLRESFVPNSSDSVVGRRLWFTVYRTTSGDGSSNKRWKWCSSGTGNRRFEFFPNLVRQTSSFVNLKVLAKVLRIVERCSRMP